MARNLTKERILEIIADIEDQCYNQCYSGNGSPPSQPFVITNKPPPNPEVISRMKFDIIYNSVLSLLIKTYGTKSEVFSNFKSQFSGYNTDPRSMDYEHFLEMCLSKLAFLKSEIQNDLFVSLENQISAEIVTDFLLLAKQSLDEGNKDVAAVLSCAALEDALKRIAKNNLIHTDDKVMSDIVNSLKGAQIISNAQGNMLKGYTQTRNKAFHAEWNKIERPEISAIIGFTEQLILQYLN